MAAQCVRAALRTWREGVQGRDVCSAATLTNWPASPRHHRGWSVPSQPGEPPIEWSNAFKGREQPIIDLFAATFTDSEGAEEGAVIGDLVRHQLTGTPAPDLDVFVVEEDGAIVAGAVFSRLTYDRDDRSVFVLGPVAVVTARQGEGIGQQLLQHALDTLRRKGVDVVVTYGAPAYYSRVGFKPVTESLIPAPYRLQHPEGWLAQSLTEAELPPLMGKARCVEAFNNPVFW